MLPDDVADAIVRMGLAPARRALTGEPLTGGVSSEIWRIEADAGPVCVKRALARLNVAAVWEAPVERNRYERAWLQRASRIVPAAVPAVLGHDDRAGLFAMTWYDPATHPVWKAELREGRVDVPFAAAVGDTLGRIHAATADDADIAARFDTATLFAALRLDPYLRATAAAHPRHAARLDALYERTASTRRVLVHGDVSPKNMLVGACGPVLLDAECATCGDPAFDLAFCANHLLLKVAWKPVHRAAYLAALDALVAAYLAHVTWEAPAGVEARAASLLPALLLARVDGKSPVEYLDEDARGRVRSAACWLLDATPPVRIAEVSGTWMR